MRHHRPVSSAGARAAPGRWVIGSEGGPKPPGAQGGGNVRTVAIPFPACPGSHVRRWSARTAQPSEADATSNPSSRSRARRAATWA
jgi:hypothetical protein